MAKTKYYATDSLGDIHTRSSSRVYTHTVVVRRGHHLARRRLQRRLDARGEQAPDDYDYYQSLVDRSYHYVGGVVGGTLRYPNRDSEKTMTEDAERALATLGGRSRDQYVKDALAQTRADHAAEIEGGYYDRFHNAGWCGSYRLAQKLATRELAGYIDGAPEEVAILEAHIK